MNNSEVKTDIKLPRDFEVVINGVTFKVIKARLRADILDIEKAGFSKFIA